MMASFLFFFQILGSKIPRNQTRKTAAHKRKGIKTTKNLGQDSSFFARKANEADNARATPPPHKKVATVPLPILVNPGIPSDTRKDNVPQIIANDSDLLSCIFSPPFLVSSVFGNPTDQT
jgi:hypothetical protein